MLTNLMEQSPPWETDCCSFGQDLSRLLW